MARILILGAGFGGLTVATELGWLLPDGHEIVLVDRNEQFSMGLRKLWELVGHATIAEGSRSRRHLQAREIRFLQDEVVAVDPGAPAATLAAGGPIEADYLVVALGCEPRPDLVEDLGEHGHDMWDVAGARGAAEALARFDGGQIAIVIAGVPYTCPPAPYECAMHVDEHLRERGIRDRSPVEVWTVQPMLMPNAGRDGSAWLAEQLAARDIAFRVGCTFERIEPGRVVAGESLDFELLFAVPPHRVPAVVKASGLTGDGEWIAVDKGTLETSYPRVFAIGDVTLIPLANGLPLPKAGLIAELEGLRVAAAIVAEVGGGSPPPPFDGTGICFLEMGKDQAALVDGAFFAEPEPQVLIAEPTALHAEEKRRFEAERLERWFAGPSG